MLNARIHTQQFQYEVGCRKVCRAMLNLSIGESRASEAGKNAQVVAYTEVEVGLDRHGFYFGVAQGTHRRRFHLGGHRLSHKECSLHSDEG